MEESSKEKKALFPAKGKRGYLKGKKLKNLLIVILFIGLIAGLMITGILITGNKKNIFTIMAILNVLPMAHFLTALIAVFPYKSPALDEYESVCTGKEDAMLTEIIVTSPKLKAAELSYAVQGSEGIVVIVVYVIDLVINGIICLVIWKKIGKTMDFEEMRENW